MKKIIIITMLAMFTLPLITGTTTKIYPSDDAFVRNRYPNNNYGTGNWFMSLRAGYNVNFGTDRTYLKFDLSSLQGRIINSANLSLDPTSIVGSPFLQVYFVEDNDWDEETITWNNKPSYSTFIDSKSITYERVSFDIDVSLMNGNQLSLLIKENGGDDDVQFFSKDLDTGGGDEVFWPYLEINYENGVETCPSADYSNVCCSLNPIQMMGFINAFNNFGTNYNPLKMMEFINKFNQFEPLC